MKRWLIIILVLIVILVAGCKRTSKENSSNGFFNAADTALVDEPGSFEYILTFTPIANFQPTETVTPNLSPEPSTTPTAITDVSGSPIPSATNSLSATLSLTPTQNFSQTPTAAVNNQLTRTKGDGYYIVGTDISTGKWESQGNGDDCLWTIHDQDGGIEKSYFGYAGGTVNILSAYEAVEFYDCGNWDYIEGVTQSLLQDAAADKSDGIYTIGVEIATGTWQSQGTGDNCYWSIYDDRQNLLQLHIGDAGGTVVLSSAQYEVLFDGCGDWQYLGP